MKKLYAVFTVISILLFARYAFPLGEGGIQGSGGGGSSLLCSADNQVGVWDNATQSFKCGTPAGAGNVLGGLTSAVGELASYGDTGGKLIGRSLFVLAGPASTAKTYTFPNSNATIRTSLDAIVMGPASSTDSYFAYFDGTTGKLLKEGQSTVNPAFSTINVYGTNSLNLGTASSLTGQLTFKSAGSANTFLIAPGTTGANIGWTLPTAAPAGNDYILRSSITGVLSYVDPATLGGVTGATANRGLVATSTTLGLIETCGTDNTLKWNGSAWVCTAFPAGGAVAWADVTGRPTINGLVPDAAGSVLDNASNYPALPYAPTSSTSTATDWNKWDGGATGLTAATGRTSLGLGTMATQASDNVAITGGTITGITDLTVADGGTGRSTGTTAYALVATGTTATGAQQTLASGATTEVLVGGGASALPVWTTATGTGAPVRAGSPTFTGTVGAAVITATGAVTASEFVSSATDNTRGVTVPNTADPTGANLAAGKVWVNTTTDTLKFRAGDNNSTISLLSTAGTAALATALAANGANCSAGQAPLGVDASGAAEGCWTPGSASAGGTTGDIQWKAADNTLVGGGPTWDNTNKIFSTPRSATVADGISFYELTGNGDNYVGWVAPDNVTESYRLVMPAAKGTVDQYMKLGADNVTFSWATLSGGGDMSAGSTYGGLIFGDATPDTEGEIGYASDVLSIYTTSLRTVDFLEKAQTVSAVKTYSAKPIFDAGVTVTGTGGVGSAIDNAIIGANTAAAATVTTLSATGIVSLGNGATSTQLNMTDTDVAHGVTTLAPTNTYGRLSEMSGTKGGLHVTGFADGSDQEALELKAVMTSDPDDGVAALKLDGYAANGTGVQALGTGKTLLRVTNNDAARITVLGNGDTTFVGTVTASSITMGADPADSGAVRLSNNTAVAWEQSTPGTDIFLALDSSNIFQVGQNAANITLGGPTKVTTAVTPTSAGAGTLGTAALPWGNTYLDNGVALYVEDESLTLTATANTITVGTGTGVTDISIGALNLATTGTITGGIMILDNVVNPTAAQVYGSWNTITTAGTVTLPAAAPGMSTCIATEGALEITLELDGSDTFVLAGVTMTAGEAIINTTAEAAGDYICVIATSAVKWRVAGKQGTWTQATP